MRRGERAQGNVICKRSNVICFDRYLFAADAGGGNFSIGNNSIAPPELVRMRHALGIVGQS